jgi:GH15 family glucan-1,4-alpha-glucosidase
MELELAAGDTHDLVLELTDAELLGEPVAAHVAWDATHAAWRQTVPELDAAIVGRRDAELALAVLSGLTASSGGMSAAATMGLPERANAGRNYDYRYAWIRDQCYAGRAVAAHGPLSLLDTAVQFVSERLMADGPGLKPAYTVRGGSVPDERALTHLSGYPGGADIIGNQVNRQFQLDGFGEALQLFAAAASLDRLDTNHWPAVEAAAKAIEARWQDPDCGIWELDKQHWAHSRLTCAAGLRAMAAQLVSKRSAQWSSLADAIVADTAADSLHPDGRWQRSPGDDRVDAALLLPALRGALPRDDPRTLATLTAVEDQLVEDGYVYRFRQGTGPPGQDEGAFLLCGFILALARNQQGNLVGARAMFERNRAAGGSSGLLSEEFDVAQRQLRGNYPQAFVHAMLLECSATLAGDTHRGD